MRSPSPWPMPPKSNKKTPPKSPLPLPIRRWSRPPWLDKTRTGAGSLPPLANPAHRPSAVSPAAPTRSAVEARSCPRRPRRPLWPRRSTRLPVLLAGPGALDAGERVADRRREVLEGIAGFRRVGEPSVSSFSEGSEFYSATQDFSGGLWVLEVWTQETGAWTVLMSQVTTAKPAP